MTFPVCDGVGGGYQPRVLYQSAILIHSVADNAMQCNCQNAKRRKLCQLYVAGCVVQGPSVCSKLARVAAEALLLVRQLHAHNIARLLKQPPAELKATLGHFRLSELVTTDGRKRAADLLMLLLKKHTRGGALPDTFATELRSGCPTFFPYHQQQYIAAYRELEAVGKPGLPLCALCNI